MKMFFIRNILFLIAFVIGILSLQGFKAPFVTDPPVVPDGLEIATFVPDALMEASAQAASAGEFTPPPPTFAYRYTVSLDTITNAANDTIVIPATFMSRYTFAYSLRRTSISGTANVAVKIEECNSVSGTDWHQVDATSGTGATSEYLTGDEVYGLRHRIIVDGTGTQSTSYAIECTFKKKE